MLLSWGNTLQQFTEAQFWCTDGNPLRHQEKKSKLQKNNIFFPCRTKESKASPLLDLGRPISHLYSAVYCPCLCVWLKSFSQTVQMCENTSFVCPWQQTLIVIPSFSVTSFPPISLSDSLSLRPAFCSSWAALPSLCSLLIFCRLNDEWWNENNLAHPLLL